MKTIYLFIKKAIYKIEIEKLHISSTDHVKETTIIIIIN